MPAQLFRLRRFFLLFLTRSYRRRSLGISISCGFFCLCVSMSRGCWASFLELPLFSPRPWVFPSPDSAADHWTLFLTRKPCCSYFANFEDIAHVALQLRLLTVRHIASMLQLRVTLTMIHRVRATASSKEKVHTTNEPLLSLHI